MAKKKIDSLLFDCMVFFLLHLQLLPSCSSLFPLYNYTEYNWSCICWKLKSELKTLFLDLKGKFSFFLKVMFMHKQRSCVNIQNCNRWLIYLIERKWISNCFDNQLIVQVMFRAKMLQKIGFWFVLVVYMIENVIFLVLDSC